MPPKKSNQRKKTLTTHNITRTIKLSKAVKKKVRFHLENDKRQDAPTVEEKPGTSQSTKKTQNSVPKKSADKKRTAIKRLAESKTLGSSKYIKPVKARKRGSTWKKDAAEKVHNLRTRQMNPKESVDSLTISELGTKGLMEVKKTKTDIQKLRVSKLSQVFVRDKSAEYESNIYGMDIRNGVLFIADFENKALKIVTLDNRLHTTMPFFNYPYDVAFINNMTAVITTGDHTIHFLDMTNPLNPSIQRSTKLGFDVAGLTVLGDNLIIVSWDEPPSIKMIDMEGNVVWCTSKDVKGKKLFEYPRSITTTVIDGETRVIVCEEHKDALILLDAKTGHFIKRINGKGKAPHGLSKDDDGNIYVCYSGSDEIGVWSADLKRCRILLTDKQLQSSPQAVCFNSTANELIVAYFDNDSIDRFKISCKLG